MTPERWRRLEELFARALELAPRRRRALLEETAREDAELGRRLADLLAADAAETTGGGSLVGAAIAAEAERFTRRGDPLPAGRRLGPWRVEERLGQGGMSTVYRAVRADRQFEKRVAVKVLRRGPDGEETRRRFEIERQILAHLEHPNIARLLDAGATEEGLPYVVMEYVEGVALDFYCDRRRLGVIDRLRLFETVCQAVAYAHQNLIVHRDLKPSNILVMADGTPKLLDFGIAKLLNPALTPHTVALTGQSRRLLTPGYASPEQFRGGALTTASDVYSLGVLLYELLCGRPPFPLVGHEPEAAEHMVRERLPEPPSRALARQGEPAAGELAARRGLRPEALRRRLEGDLDVIVLTALRKEPRRRYPSAAHLASDLARHRAGLPVAARPDTFGYRAAKFLRRHRWGAAAGLAAALLLLAFVAALLVQSARLARQRDVAQRERAKAERVSTFMVEMFQLPEPEEARRRLDIRRVLDGGAERAYAELRDEPEIQSLVLHNLARGYLQLGFFEAAEPLLRDAVALRRRALGRDHPEVATSLYRLAVAHAEMGSYERAEELFREVLALRRRALGPEHPEVAYSLESLALVRHDQGDYAAAEPLYRESLALLEKIFGPDHPETAHTLDNLGLLLCDRGEYGQAEGLLRRALEARREHLEADDTSFGHNFVNLGVALVGLGRGEEGEALLRRAVALRREQLGADHPEVARALHRLAEATRQRGDLQQAEALHREALELRRARLGSEHPEVAASLTGLGLTLSAAGAVEAAEPLLRQALEIYRGTLPPNHPEIADATAGLGRLLLERGDRAAAEPLLRRALDIRRRALRPADPRVTELAALLADPSP